uniref:Uncharacterized protein n=1 Tax=Cyprinus carpio TaxID=7962 RepID=A0A8C2ECF1_CYPCA
LQSFNWFLVILTFSAHFLFSITELNLACEGGSVHLSCSEKQWKRKEENRIRSTCHCLSRCDARKRCSVPALNTVFSDPCAWTYKYLYVMFCVKRKQSLL